MALYRRYRPATFAEVVGQEQVTEPLSVALDSGRVNHAFLFSGPRGCGKTSSARILARSLNCEQGPTSTPCGRCNSCLSLAPGGSGNLDVTELDAASHRGIDDMRELRERAYYAPAESRYRVFIIDEAHMITKDGANALLKIVEEPPEHLIFIFATTEPEAVIPTIRSRTHHYPFRLLTPQSMRQLIETVVAAEGAQVEDTVYPLLIQAGGGSPRDTLSILDQLLAGAGPDGLSYEEALPLLGVTDFSLIDDTVGALADNNAATLFITVDRVIEAGHEPRRFALDLLDRLRDLMILQAVPDAFGLGLVAAPADRAEVLSAQAARFTGAQLARLAEEVNARIADLRGATSPRLLLEILCAHLLVDTTPAPVPVADSDRDAAAAAAAAAARRAQEKRAERVDESSADEPATRTQRPERPEPRIPGQQPQPEPQRAEPDEPVAAHVEPETEGPQGQQWAQRPARQEAPAQEEAAADREQPAPGPTAPQESAPEPEPAQPAQPERPAQADPGVNELVAQIRSRWAKLRDEISQRNRTAGIMLAEARVLGLRDGTLVIGHNTGALAQRLNAESSNADIVAVVSEEAGRQLQVDCVIGTDPSAAGFPPPGQTNAQATWNPPRPSARESHAGGASSSREGGDSAEESERPASQSAADSAWGQPAQLGGQAAGTPSPMSAPARDTAAEPAPSRRETGQASAPDWRETAARAAHRAEELEQERRNSPVFGNGVPLPPEPAPDFGEDNQPPPPAPEEQTGHQGGFAGTESQSPQPQSPPTWQAAPARPEQPAQQEPPAQPAPPMSRDEEESMMVEEARAPGQRDRRDAMDVAMELLKDELGARKL